MLIASNPAVASFSAYSASLSGTLAARHDIGNREPASRLEHPEGFAQHPILVARQVDDAVRDDDVDAIVGQRYVLDLAFEKFHVLDARLALVFAGERQHLVGH